MLSVFRIDIPQDISSSEWTLKADHNHLRSKQREPTGKGHFARYQSITPQVEYKDRRQNTRFDRSEEEKCTVDLILKWDVEGARLHGQNRVQM